MKHLAVAAVLGAGISSFLYLAVKYGIDAGYRLYDHVSRRREAMRERNGL